MSKPNPEKRAIEHANQFMNDNDRPSPERLHALAHAGTVESIEELQEIAEKYNVIYEENMPADQLADRISLAMEQEADNDL